MDNRETLELLMRMNEAIQAIIEKDMLKATDKSEYVRLKLDSIWLDDYEDRSFRAKQVMKGVFHG